MPEQSDFQMVVRSNPLTVRKTFAQAPAGISIQEAVARAGIPDYVTVYVELNGVPVLCKDWPTTIVKHADLLVIQTAPAGGDGGKNPLRTILMVVLMIVAQPLGAALAGANATALAVNVATAAVMVAGTLAINALCPPPRPDSQQSSYKKDSPTYALSGSRNNAQPYGPIPILLGRHRIVPPYAAQPYTENIGGEQYLYVLFALGHGLMNVSDLKHGETSFEDYQDVEIEILRGDDPDAISALFPTDHYTEGLAINLTYVAGWQTRTTQPDAKRIALDITCPQGLVEFGEYGVHLTRFVGIEVQYAVAGSGEWVGAVDGVTVDPQDLIFDLTSAMTITPTPRFVVCDKFTGVMSLVASVPAWSWGVARLDWYWFFVDDSQSYQLPAIVDLESPDAPFDVTYDRAATAVPWIFRFTFHVTGGTIYTDPLSITGASASTQRKTYSFPVTAGQYDVRVRRTTSDTDSTRIIDSVVWTGLRTQQDAPAAVLETGVVQVALRIRATEQLNGVLDQFNCVAEIECPDYDVDTDTWVVRSTRNPASLYRYVLQGPGNKRACSDDQVDIELLQEWHTRCVDEGWEFNHYVDYRSSVDTILQMVAAAGRAAPGYVDGKYSVVMDRPQDTVVQMFTPRNSWGYSYKKTFVKMPHAFRVRFWNKEESWREDERIVYADGYDEETATEFEELALPGIDDEDLAYKHARYHMATAILRPEIHTFFADFESLVCTRGDRIKFAHDVISAGLGYGRVKSSTIEGGFVTEIEVDAGLVMDGAKDYGVVFRQHNGDFVTSQILTDAGEEVFVFQPLNLAEAYAPDSGALISFGELGEEVLDLIVKSITHQGDLVAQLTCLHYAPEVHDADQGEIPAFSTHITTPSDPFTSYIPVISEILSDDSVVSYQSDGGYLCRIKVTFDTQDLPVGLVDDILVRYRVNGTSFWENTSTEGNSVFLDVGIVEGETYEIQARYLINNRLCQWSASETHVVVGRTVPWPGAIGFASAVVVGDNPGRGEFATLQEALDALQEVGNGSVFVRNGSYAEEEIVPPNLSINIVGESLTGVQLKNTAGSRLFNVSDFTGDLQFSQLSIVSQNTAAYSEMIYADSGFGFTGSLDFKGVRFELADAAAYMGDGDTGIEVNSGSGSVIIQGDCQFIGGSAGAALYCSRAFVHDSLFVGQTGFGFENGGTAATSRGNVVREFWRDGIRAAGKIVDNELVARDDATGGSTEINAVVALTGANTIGGNRVTIETSRAAVDVSGIKYSDYLSTQNVAVSKNVVGVTATTSGNVYAYYLEGLVRASISGGSARIDSDGSGYNFGVYIAQESITSLGGANNTISGMTIDLVNAGSHDAGVRFAADTSGNRVSESVVFLNCGTNIVDLGDGNITPDPRVTDYSSYGECISQIGSDEKILILDKTLTFTGGATFPANILVRTRAGCVYTVPDGEAVACDGGLDMTAGGVFRGPGAGSGSLAVNGPFICFPGQQVFGDNLVVTGLGLAERVYPDMWAENTVPGTTNMTAAINTVLALGRPCYLTHKNYLVNDTLAAVAGSGLIGHGPGETILTFDYSVTGKPIFSLAAAAHYCRFWEMTIRYSSQAPISDTAAYAFKMAATSSVGWGTFKNLLIENVYGAISAQDYPWFNNLLENVFVRSWSGRAINVQPSSGGNSGNVFTNVYLVGESPGTNIGGFITYSGGTAVFNNLNCEWGVCSSLTPINFGSDSKGITVNGLHLEGITYAGTGVSSAVYIGLVRTGVTINNMDLQTITVNNTVTDWSVLHLAGAYSRAKAENILFVSSGSALNNTGSKGWAYVDSDCDNSVASIEMTGCYDEGSLLSSNAIYEAGGSYANGFVVKRINDYIGDVSQRLADGAGQTVVTYGTTALSSFAGTGDGTLGDGTFLGQKKRILMVTGGNNWDLTISHHETSDPEVVRFATAGDFLDLEWGSSVLGWVTIKAIGVTYP